MSDVFLSHSSNDRETVERVCAFLEEKGLTCWMAPRDILPGSDWAASISTAITTSKVFLIIFSKNSATSQQVAREVGVAEAKKGIFVIPYKIDDTELSGALQYYLTGAHWITADYSKGDYKLGELYSIIAGITGKSVQNITNNTYIDHLHIHNSGGANIQEELNSISGFNGISGAAATQVNPMQTHQVPPPYQTQNIQIVTPPQRTVSKQTGKVPFSQNTQHTISNFSVSYGGWICKGIYIGEINILNKAAGKGSFKGTYIDNYNNTISITYDGIFQNNMITGKGVAKRFTPNSAHTEDGTFKNGMLNGEGKISTEFNNGTCTVKEGKFVGGKLNGKGKINSKSDNGTHIVQEGKFVDGRLNGEGKINSKFNNGTRIVQEGKFVDGVLNGEGKISTEFNDGNECAQIALGNFVDGYLNGKGEYTIFYRNGDTDTYEGTFKNYKCQQGTMTRRYCANGEHYTYKGDYYQDNDNKTKFNNGTCIYYDTNGNITKWETYKNGKKITYTPTLQVNPMQTQQVPSPYQTHNTQPVPPQYQTQNTQAATPTQQTISTQTEEVTLPNQTQNEKWSTRPQPTDSQQDEEIPFPHEVQNTQAGKQW